MIVSPKTPWAEIYELLCHQLTIYVLYLFWDRLGWEKTQHFSLWKSLWFSFLLQKDKYYFFFTHEFWLKLNVIVFWQAVYKAVKYVHILAALLALATEVNL